MALMSGCGHSHVTYCANDLTMLMHTSFLTSSFWKRSIYGRNLS